MVEMTLEEALQFSKDKLEQLKHSEVIDISRYLLYRRKLESCSIFTEIRILFLLSI